MGVPKSTLYGWIALLEQGDDLKPKPGQGRRRVLATTATVKKIRNHFNRRAGRSQKKCAKTFNMHQSYVSKWLQNRTKVRHLKRTKRPKMTASQKKLARPKCRRLYLKYGEVDFVMDDESYFTFSNTTLSGNDRFYSDDIEKTPYDVKHALKSKYEPKVLVWIAISPRGLSKPLIQR